MSHDGYTIDGMDDSDERDSRDAEGGADHWAADRALRRPNRAARDGARRLRRTPDTAGDGAAERRGRPAVRHQRRGEERPFRCRHCRTLVGPVPSGGRHRNHCPVCLCSRHVDERLPGDRQSACGATMAPIGVFVRPGGEYALIHRCLACGVARHNRVAADDDFALVLRLPDLTRRAPAAAEPAAAVGAEETSA